MPPRKKAGRGKRNRDDLEVDPAKANLHLALDMYVEEADSMFTTKLSEMDSMCKTLSREVDLFFSSEINKIPKEILKMPAKKYLEMDEACLLQELAGKSDANSSSSSEPVEANGAYGTSNKAKTKMTSAKKPLSKTDIRGLKKKLNAKTSGSVTPDNIVLKKSKVITPKFDMRAPNTPGIARKPKANEVIVSLEGSPLQNEEYFKQNAGVFVPLADGKVVNVTSDFAVSPNSLQALPSNTMQQLKSIQTTLNKLMENAKQVEK